MWVPIGAYRKEILGLRESAIFNPLHCEHTVFLYLKCQKADSTTKGVTRAKQDVEVRAIGIHGVESVKAGE